MKIIPNNKSYFQTNLFKALIKNILLLIDYVNSYKKKPFTSSKINKKILHIDENIFLLIFKVLSPIHFTNHPEKILNLKCAIKEKKPLKRVAYNLLPLIINPIYLPN
jgi:hypothetical protein